jgi:hypothetical protein
VPAVTAAVGLSAETHVMLSWCPKKLSSAESVDSECSVRWRESEAERTWADSLARGGKTTDWEG